MSKLSIEKMSGFMPLASHLRQNFEQKSNFEYPPVEMSSGGVVYSSANSTGVKLREQASNLRCPK